MANTTESPDNQTGSSLDAQCSNEYVVSHCSFTLSVVGGVITTVIVFFGVIFNSISFIAFTKIQLNAGMFFVFKCLTIFDSTYLITLFMILQVDLFGYLLGYGNIRITFFAYIRHYFVIPLYRVSAVCSYWTVCVFTVQR